MAEAVTALGPLGGGRSGRPWDGNRQDDGGGTQRHDPGDGHTITIRTGTYVSASPFRSSAVFFPPCSTHGSRWDSGATDRRSASGRSTHIRPGATAPMPCGSRSAGQPHLAPVAGAGSAPTSVIFAVVLVLVVLGLEWWLLPALIGWTLGLLLLGLLVSAVIQLFSDTGAGVGCGAPCAGGSDPSAPSWIPRDGLSGCHLDRRLRGCCACGLPRHSSLLAASVAVAVMTPATAVPPAAAPPATVTAQAGPVPAPDDTRTTFSLVLPRRESAARKRLKAVSDPHSTHHRQFLSRSQIRHRYGAQPSDLRAVRRSARAAGLTTATDATGLFIMVTGQVRDLEPWLGQQILVQKATLPPINSRSIQQEEVFLVEAYDSACGPAQVRARDHPLLGQDCPPAISSSIVFGNPPRGAQPRDVRRRLQGRGAPGHLPFDQLARAYGGYCAPRPRVAGQPAGHPCQRRGVQPSPRCSRAVRCAGSHIQPGPRPGMIGNRRKAAKATWTHKWLRRSCPAVAPSMIESPEVGGTFYLAWAAAFGLPALPTPCPSRTGCASASWMRSC